MESAVKTKIAKEILDKWREFKKEDFPLERPSEVIELDAEHRDTGIRALFISGKFVDRANGTFHVSQSSVSFLRHLGIKFTVVEKAAS